MGIIAFVDLFDVRDKELGASRPVGKIESVVDTSATRIEFDEKNGGEYGPYVFGEETLLKYISTTRQTAQPGVAVRRQEFKVASDGSQVQLIEGAVLIVTQVPHSGYWASVKPFRPWRPSRPEVLDTASTVADLISAIDVAKTDLFETRKGIFTAAIEEDDFRVFLKPSVRSQYKSLGLVLGIVPGINGNLNRYHKIEMEILQSPRLQSTIKAVAAGAPLGPKKDLYLPERLRDDLQSLMFFSVRQAMAGAGNEDDAETYQGRPVGLYARHLFMDHAFNLTRSARETRHEVFTELDALESGDGVKDQIARFLALYFA